MNNNNAGDFLTACEMIDKLLKYSAPYIKLFMCGLHNVVPNKRVETRHK